MVLRMLALATLGLCGCAAVAPAHADRFESAAITVADAGLQPAGVARVRRFGTVVFRNALPGMPVRVTVMRPLASSLPCSTMLGFTPEGDASVARGVLPQAFAALCFHEAGSFPFVVEITGRQLRGTVEVADEVR
ncbi:MAG: hypothetical protein IT458_06440 [Planctomycetes bacterium]|nr:hypothetical protein [Planctomycetota bacterium]